MAGINVLVIRFKCLYRNGTQKNVPVISLQDICENIKHGADCGEIQVGPTVLIFRLVLPS